MGQNNQKDQKGPKMTAAVMLVQNNQNNQKIWSSHISHTILKVRFFGTPCTARFLRVEEEGTTWTIGTSSSGTDCWIHCSRATNSLLLVPEAVFHGDRENWRESKRYEPYSTVDIPKISLTTFFPIYFHKNNQYDL